MLTVFRGKIIKGNGLGTKFGFPTLNLLYKGDECGVFVGRVFLENKWWNAVIHIGSRPTINDQKIICEVHVLDWKGDYKGELKVELMVKLRDTIKFFSKEILVAQIEKDVESARNYLENSFFIH